jgi:chemotaxis protein MotA
MDLSTVIGLLAGAALLAVSINLGGSIQLYLDVPSLVMVLGGMICSTLISYPLSDVLGVFRTLRKAFVHQAASPEEIIQKIVALAAVARREGILALEGHTAEAGDPFLVKSIQLAVDGTTPELIKDILTTELAFMEDRHATGHGILGALGAFAPAFGMIGTLVGLVAMLANLTDPTKLGAGLALALLTTLYGAVFANLIFLPLQGKLKARTTREILLKQIIIEGILAIQSGDNPRIVEEKLKSFISPGQRDSLEFGR